jgi:polyhydroxybutyrate depolymerase
MVSMKRLLGLCALVLSLAAAAPSFAADGKVVHGQLRVDGLVRSYRVFVPAALPSGKRVPAVLLFHGLGGSGAQLERSSGFDDLAASHAFLAVYPDGAGRAWNAGSCCAFGGNAVDDVGFVDALLRRLKAQYPIAPRRVYAAGHSNGAFFAYRLACERAGRFAAVGAVAGTLVTSPCHPARPVSVVAIHGLADPLVPYAGGGLFANSVPETIAVWRRVDSCPARAKTTVEPPVTTRLWSPCARRTAVELVTVAGAGHAWPGANGPQGSIASEAEASVLLWRFFAAHPRR